MNLYASGSLIAGQYEVAGRPLMGGMGVVYLCLDHGNGGRPVALKTFKPEYLPDRETRDRFLREGTTWVALGSHPHIVRCHQVARVGDGREVYLVLELVAKEQGREDASLRSWLAPGRPLGEEQALLIGLQIARGMKHATEVIPGFVHRDLKPENVLVGADRLSNAKVNRVRVTDFGLASVLQAEEVGVTGPDAEMGRTQLTRGVVGTPLYMAPEQWWCEPVSVATDVYAVGCMLVEMLTGRRAVGGKSVGELERGHCGGEAQKRAEGLPGSERELLWRCLALKPEGRIRNWAELELGLADAYAQACGRAAPDAEAVEEQGRAERMAGGWSYGNIGLSYLDLGKAEVARGYFEQAVEVGRVEGERELEGAALGNLGLAYAHLGDARRAIVFHEQVLVIVREIGDRRGEGAALGNLGNAYDDLGDARRAIEFYEQALVIAREIGDRRAEGTDLSNLGVAYKYLGDARRAIEFYEQALVIRREIGDRRGEGQTLDNLGLAYADFGDARRAIEFHEQALVITREIGDRRGEGAALGNLGVAYRNLGDARRAIEFHEQRLVIAREIGGRRGEGNALGNLGSAYLQLGDARRAIELYEQALVISREIGDRRGEGLALGNLGIAYFQLGDARRAIEFYEQHRDIAREIGDAKGAAGTSLNMALLYAGQGEVARALPLALQAAQLYAQIGHAEYAQRAQQLVAQLQGGGEGGRANTGPAPAKILADFAPLIEGVVAATRGNRQMRTAVEAAFDHLEQNGWYIAEPIHRIWAGERDGDRLTAGLDDSDALIVREILRRLP
jgi:tetratricopeptide (TPR) repeat protein